MKSWADVSSDEESIDDLPAEMEAQTLEESAPPPETVETPVDGADAETDVAPTQEPPTKTRTYNFPDQPPFTAFIGNLPYALTDPEELQAAVAKSAADYLEEKVNILGGRLGFDRDGKPRGFGYVELETLDQLKALMKLNDGKCLLAGRNAQVDTAIKGNSKPRRGSNNHNRRSGNGGDIDGSKFRGGRFNGSGDRGGSRNDKDNGPPLQRTSLKLAPRTKRTDDDSKGASPNIFGGARARDDQAWEDRRRLSKQENNKNNNNNNNKGGSRSDDRRRSSTKGRGGRGDGGRGNKGESGRRRGSQNNNGAKQISPEERAAATKAAEEKAAAATASAKPKEPANKFALLMDSDSD